jgi:cell division protein FtsI (penicillin-binding protein 3)
MPDFNPNNRDTFRSAAFRNRSVTDVLEPGSTVKPFTIAAALESKRFVPDSRIDTSPGMLHIGRYTVKDTRDYGLLTVSKVIMKSSNVGASKIAMALGKKPLWQMFRKIGFGSPTRCGLPGETDGRLVPYQRWRRVEHVTQSFGYGVSVTPLQLARAYIALANDGVVMPVSVLRRDMPAKGQRVMSSATARQVSRMLELAVSDHGTGREARIPQYRVAGKTGTVHKLGKTGYAEDHYFSVFAGFAPASHPRLVMAVVIDDPQNGVYYGGKVAAPVYARVMAGALRMLNIVPDSQVETRHYRAALDTQGVHG